MAKSRQTLPLGNQAWAAGVPVRTSEEVGNIFATARRSQNLTQLDIAGIGNTGNRFIVDLENGKPTLQLQKVLDALSLVGLEVLIRRKAR